MHPAFMLQQNLQEWNQEHIQIHQQHGPKRYDPHNPAKVGSELNFETSTVNLG